MKSLYLELTTGISGDMFMAALLDLGVPLNALKEGLSSLNLKGYQLKTHEVKRRGLRARSFKVVVEEEDRQVRNLPLISEIIQGSQLPQQVKEMAIQVFTQLGKAEARVHQTPLEEVHFHEVGAMDSIIDIVGVSLGVYLLEVETITASPVPLGRGFTKSSHGQIPVPVPATLELLSRVPCYGTGIEAELVTPTGAALLTTLAKGFSPLPEMTLLGVGIGAGSLDLEVPNILRAYLGEEKDSSKEEVLIFTTNLDDLSPELLPYLRERLLAAGALDVYITPTLMKKGRPGFQIQVLLLEDKKEELAGILFHESSTLGIRMRREERLSLKRSEQIVMVCGYKVRVKLGIYQGEVIDKAPEYRDCLKVAQEKKIPLKEVYRLALKAYEEKKGENTHG